MRKHLVSILAAALEPVPRDGPVEAFGMGGVQPELVDSTGEGLELDACFILFHV